MEEKLLTIVKLLLNNNKKEMSNLLQNINIETTISPEKFYFLYVYELNQLLNNMLDNISNNDKVKFLYIHYDFFEYNIEKLIEIKTHTSICIVDQSKYILSVYLQHLLNKEINYKNNEWYCPKFGESNDWICFCDSLMELYYGRVKDYLKIYKKLLEL